MSLLPILTFPDERLRTVAKPVTRVDARVRKLVEDMFETMHHAQGIGLAATQVDVHERVIVIETRGVDDSPGERLVLINPEILHRSEDLKPWDEGCLSVPGYYDSVNRPANITFTAQDENGQRYTRECDGILAVVVQHEMDHLNGKVFVDYLSPLKRKRIKGRMLKRSKEPELAQAA